MEEVQETLEYVPTLSANSGTIVYPENKQPINVSTDQYILTKNGVVEIYDIEYVIKSDGVMYNEGIHFSSFQLSASKNAGLTSNIEGIIDTAKLRIILPIEDSIFREKTEFAPTFTLPDGITVVPDDTTIQNFAYPISYTLREGTNSVTYTIDVVIKRDSIVRKVDTIAFTSFTFSTTHNSHVPQDVHGIIDAANNKVLLSVDQDTYDEDTTFVPTFTLPDGVTSAIASGTVQDFASPVVYTLSKDGSSIAVSVEVAIDSSSISHTNIVTFDSFTFNQAQNAHIRTHELSDIIGVIDTVRKKVTLTVSTATYSTSSIFTPTFTLPDGVSSNIANNTAQDFSSSVFYTLTKDQVDNVYEAQVVIDSSSVSAKKPYINSFVLEKSKNSHITEDEDISGLINHETHEIALLVRQATIQNTSNFTPTITTQNGGTVNPDSITERNFETSVFYTLTKEDYSISYKVTVYIAEELPDSIEQTQISVFDFERIYNSFLSYSYRALIDHTSQTIDISIPSSIFRNHLDDIVPTIEGNYKVITPDPAAYVDESKPSKGRIGLALDSNNQQEFIITNFDGEIKTYTLTIHSVLSDVAKIEAITLEKRKNAQMNEELTDISGYIDHTRGAILFYLRQNTYLTNTIFVPTITLPDGATVTPGTNMPINLSLNDLQYIVTSESGNYTKTYTVQVSINRDSIINISSVKLTNSKTSAYGTSIDISGSQKIIKKKDATTYDLYLLPVEYEYLENKPLLFSINTAFGETVQNAHSYVTLPHTFTIRSKDLISTKDITIRSHKLPVPNSVCIASRPELIHSQTFINVPIPANWGIFVETITKRLMLFVPDKLLATTHEFTPTIGAFADGAYVDSSSPVQHNTPFAFYTPFAFPEDNLEHLSQTRGKNRSNYLREILQNRLRIHHLGDGVRNYYVHLYPESLRGRIDEFEGTELTGDQAIPFTFKMQHNQDMRNMSDPSECDYVYEYDLYGKTLYMLDDGNDDRAQYIFIHMDADSYDSYIPTLVKKELAFKKIGNAFRFGGKAASRSGVVGELTFKKDDFTVTYRIEFKSHEASNNALQRIFTVEQMEKITQDNFIEKSRTLLIRLTIRLRHAWNLMPCKSYTVLLMIVLSDKSTQAQIP